MPIELPLGTEMPPTCATAYLYSVGPLHYYATVDCANPFTTGVGVSAIYDANPTGCVGDTCGGLETDPGFSSADADGLLLNTNLKGTGLTVNNGCGCGPAGRFHVRSNFQARQRAHLKDDILQRMANNADDRRKLKAEHLIANLDVNGELISDLSSSDSVKRRRAEIYAAHMAHFFSTARLAVRMPSGTSTVATKMYVEDTNLLVNLLQDTDINSGQEIESPGGDPTGWTLTNAQCFGNGSGAKHYVQIGKGNNRFIFRLYDVTNMGQSDAVHRLGQQVDPGEPAPNDVINNQNHFKITQFGEHAHILKLRTDEGNTDPNTEYLVYSAENLGAYFQTAQ